MTQPQEILPTRTEHLYPFTTSEAELLRALQTRKMTGLLTLSESERQVLGDIWVRENPRYKTLTESQLTAQIIRDI
jgi:hypothetical protein